ncbi:apolipoprotein N-acyltransferase [Alkalimarinus alittae]|uniref:Apolipoprotein N-acyltransferase n=1 Tax=Alkalimarinus alittae TaxID=2961619 RepID=A0ABY6N546_9ALTE|nr:apolipoprotein N-acyltransferase [Alkalimarinus alittae]UZE97099.1 apolipoprotein N-acyltransferase [Alkalimarinus alittae]
MNFSFILKLKWLLLPIAGVMQTLSLSPFNWWPLGILSITLIMMGMKGASAKKNLLYGWLFGLGLFGSGASWVYVSIHNFGNAPAPLAIALTTIFVAAIALFPAATFWLFRKIFNGQDRWSVLTFPAIWVLGDWFRSWFLTGFPWLYLGYGHLNTPLSGWASILGVHGITFICCLTGSAIWYFIDRSPFIRQHLKIHRPQPKQPPQATRKRLPASFIVFAAILWVIGSGASTIKWAYVKDNTPITIAAVQANIPQELKWSRGYRLKTIEIYQTLSSPHWGKTLIIWPETAIPILYDQAKFIIEPISTQASESDTTLITGIPYRENNADTGRVTIHNSIASIGKGEGIYHKQRLVPFGEYVPLEDMLRGLIEFFDLPMSSFSAGRSDQPALKEAHHNVTPYICYEIVYPDFVADNANNSDYLLTISNDSWFGHSIGPLQHLEMAQMRALENARYLVRSTNNGISAVITPDGKIQSQSAQFVRTVLTGEVFAMGGRTPFNYLGSTPLLLLCALILLIRRMSIKPTP